MFVEGEDIFYFLSLYNEKLAMPPMQKGAEDSILKGLYKFKAGPDTTRNSKLESRSKGAHLRQRHDHPLHSARAGNPRGALRCLR
jgi:pyruvate dehydrogenase E1 component